ncbi:hypothetical protein BMS3Bbin04_00289 [bacterium BMS3Bbin04]|nr:hypothetical protein BMS3Bbin04_00289 [bacterium BMS3Bbin04]
MTPSVKPAIASKRKVMGNTPPPQLSVDEKELVKAAIRKALALPTGLSDEEHVLRLLRIRNQLEKEVLDLTNPLKKTRPWIIGGWITTLVLATGVVTIGLWRAFVRYDSPMVGLDEPLAFLGWFTLAFVLAWLPIIIAWFRARSIRIRMEASEVPDAEPALMAFDVATVRHLLKQD